MAEWRAAHAALAADARRWQYATFVGYQGTDGELIEGRNCPDCGSTVYRPAAVAAAAFGEARVAGPA